MAGGGWHAHVPIPPPPPQVDQVAEECALTEMGGILGTSDRVPKLRGGCVQCISPVPSRVDIFILGVVVLDLQVSADTLFSGDCRQREGTPDVRWGHGDKVGFQWAGARPCSFLRATCLGSRGGLCAFVPVVPRR